MAIEEDVQGLELGEYVEMYTLDLTPIGGDVYYFTPTNGENGVPPVQFGGITYVPVDIQAEGFEANGKGPFPEPVIRIGNTSRTLAALVNGMDDLVGAKITRLRTLAQYLDSGDSPDPTAHFPPDIYFVEQKTVQNKLVIEFKLSSVMDLEGQKLPRRLITRNYCPYIYRRYNEANGTFDYSKATCPYVGTLYFTDKDVATSAANDKCGKRLVSCEKRFAGVGVPFGGFPGAGRFGSRL